MLYRNLGNSSLSISVIGLGGLHFGIFLDEKESAELINTAFEHGIQFIDTAPMYGSGKSELLVVPSKIDENSLSLALKWVCHLS